MAQEYKLYVADPGDQRVVREAVRQVRSHMSACASGTDDPHEFDGEVAITTYPSRTGGAYICGTLDRPAQSKWLDAEVPREEYEIPGAVAAVPHEPVDLEQGDLPSGAEGTE